MYGGGAVGQEVGEALGQKVGGTVSQEVGGVYGRWWDCFRTSDDL